MLSGMSNDDLAVRPLRPEEAASLVACFGRCYRGTYPADTFDSAERIVSAMASGALHPIGAVTPDGRVVGHMALRPHAPGALTAEAGNTVVDPDFRGHHLAARLAAELCRQCIALGWTGFVHYPTTAHPVMQRLAVDGGGVESGVLLDYIPAETDYVGFEREADAADDAHASVPRIAVVAVYQALQPSPAREVALPARWRSLLTSLYGAIGLERREAIAATPLANTSTHVTSRFDERRGLASVAIECAGDDLRDRLGDALASLPAAPTLLDVSLGDPSIDAIVETAVALGFRFGALLPETRPDADVLRLQRLAWPARPPALETPGAKHLFQQIVDDDGRRTHERVP